MAEKREDKPEFEYPIYGINWTGGIGRPAGMFWLDGRIMMAAHESPAEGALLARGAILVATLRFDPDPLERSHRGRVVERIDPRALVERGAAEESALDALADRLERL